MRHSRLANVRFDSDIAAALKRLSALDNWHALLALAADYLLVAAAVLAAESAPLLYVASLVLIGSRQRALTTILHDAAHGRAARTRWLNWVAGTFLSGYLIFQAFQPYRQSHVMNHHGHLGDPGHDPDLQLYLDTGLYDGMSRARFFWRQVLATLLLLNAIGYLWYVTRHRLLALVRCRAELVYMGLFWGAIFVLLSLLGAWRLFLLYWVVPYLTTFLIIGRFIEIAEHFPLLGTAQASSVLYSTRNRFSHAAEALFFSMHNENFHLVHHLRPEIPFWNMAKAHRVMLADAQYARANAGFGGIFFSGNGQPALIPALLSGAIALPQGVHERGQPGLAVVLPMRAGATPCPQGDRHG